MPLNGSDQYPKEGWSTGRMRKRGERLAFSNEPWPPKKPPGPSDYLDALKRMPRLPEPDKRSDLGQRMAARGQVRGNPAEQFRELEGERKKREGKVSQAEQPRRSRDSPFEELTPEEHEALMQHTPTINADDPGWGKSFDERKQQLDELLSRPQEHYDKSYQAGETGPYTAKGGPIPAGRIRGTQEFLKDYLEDLPPDVSAHKMKDGTIILRTRSDLTS